jgi:hypothetical protein
MNVFKFISDEIKSATEYKYTDEVAARTLLPLLKYYKINPSKLEQQTNAAKEERMATIGFKQIIENLVEAIRTEQLQIDTVDGIPSFTVNMIEPLNEQEEQSIKFFPRGSYDDKQYRNLDNEASIADRCYTLLACMSKKSTTLFEKMKAPDWKICEVIGHFFLAM